MPKYLGNRNSLPIFTHQLINRANHPQTKDHDNY